jgi:hypothetical protein
MRGQRLWACAAKVLVASLVTGVFAWWLWRLLERGLPVDADSFWLAAAARLAVLAVPVAAGVVMYVFVCRLLRLPEINELLDPIRRRFHRQ